jgi:hypothetical protein
VVATSSGGTRRFPLTFGAVDASAHRSRTAEGWDKPAGEEYFSIGRQAGNRRRVTSPHPGRTNEPRRAFQGNRRKDARVQSRSHVQ